MQPGTPRSATTATDNPWLVGNHVVLSASQGDHGRRWRFELGAGDDLRLTLEDRSPDGAPSGELVIVGGAALLSRGVTLPEGAEIDAVDGPGLMLKLVLELLGRAAPGGPSAVSARAAIDHGGSDELTLETLSAAASFSPPWRVQGEVRRTDESKLAFDLAFTYQVGGGPAALRFSGSWARAIPAPALDDRMSLDGWRVFTLGPQGAGVLDYGARPVTSRPATLGQLRELLKAQPPPK